MQKNASDLLAVYRRKNGLKQEAMAQLLGVNQATLSRWERGRVRPSIPMRKKLCTLLNAEVPEY